jgi:hypothetical protein
MNLLASASFGAPASLEFAGWLGCLLCFIAGVNQVLKFTDRFRAHPPGSELQKSNEFLGERLGHLQNDFGEFLKKDSANRREIYDRMRTDTNGLHEKINNVDRKVGGLETATELLSQRMVQMDGKLDRMIERGKE